MITPQQYVNMVNALSMNPMGIGMPLQQAYHVPEPIKTIPTAPVNQIVPNVVRPPIEPKDSSNPFDLL